VRSGMLLLVKPYGWICTFVAFSGLECARVLSGTAISAGFRCSRIHIKPQKSPLRQ
jgi:hypothetical protein